MLALFSLLLVTTMATGVSSDDWGFTRCNEYATTAEQLCAKRASWLKFEEQQHRTYKSSHTREAVEGASRALDDCLLRATNVLKERAENVAARTRQELEDIPASCRLPEESTRLTNLVAATKDRKALAEAERRKVSWFLPYESALACCWMQEEKTALATIRLMRSDAKKKGEVVDTLRIWDLEERARDAKFRAKITLAGIKNQELKPRPCSEPLVKRVAGCLRLPPMRTSGLGDLLSEQTPPPEPPPLPSHCADADVRAITDFIPGVEEN